MSERVLTPGAIQGYAAAVAITVPEVTELVAQIQNYGITQPDIETYYRMLKALAP